MLAASWRKSRARNQVKITCLYNEWQSLNNVWRRCCERLMFRLNFTSPYPIYRTLWTFFDQFKPENFKRDGSENRDWLVRLETGDIYDSIWPEFIETVFQFKLIGILSILAANPWNINSKDRTMTLSDFFIFYFFRYPGQDTWIFMSWNACIKYVPTS